MRSTGYLFQRPDSKFWQLKLQSPDGRREFSLKTTDRAQAEVLALPFITEHKRKLLERQPAVVAAWRHELEPNREHAGPDGGKIVATDTQLIHINHNGAVIKTTPNGRQVFQVTGAPLDLERPSVAVRCNRTVQSLLDEPRVKVATKNGDDDLIETYLQHRKITGYKEREARATWALFRELCPGVKLANASRDDGRKLVAHLQGQGNKSASVAKRVSWLTAACNFGIKEGKLKFNPFSSIVPKSKDAEKRLPFTDDDMKVIRANLDRLTPADRLMVQLLATTGMRLGEAFQTTRESKERGIRYVVIGSKNDQSQRRVPLPAKLLPHLPEAIKGPLFPDDNAENASLRLNHWLERIGIHIPRIKVIHSFRHRAQDRLRAAECPSDIRHAILGHDEKSVAEGYGEGFAVTVLKRWIDRIGF